MRFEPLPDAEPQQQRRDHGNPDRVADQKRAADLQDIIDVELADGEQERAQHNRVEHSPGQPSREQHEDIA